MSSEDPCFPDILAPSRQRGPWSVETCASRRKESWSEKSDKREMDRQNCFLKPLIWPRFVVLFPLTYFQRLGWLVKEEFANTSALTIERIILRLHKLGHFPEDAGKRVFNRIQKSK
jgi:hypothetical protein